MNWRNAAFAALGAMGVTGFLDATRLQAHGAEHEAPLVVVEADTTRHPDVSLVVSSPILTRVTVGSDAFAVREDGRPVKATATPVPTDDLSVVLAVDTSGSMQGEPMAAARAAGRSFLERMPSGVPVAVVGFAGQPRLVLPFSTDRTQQLDAVDRLQPTGETALYDGARSAAMVAASSGTARRAVVLLSDGGDTVSRSSLDDAADALRATGAETTVVELASPESDHGALERLVAPAGGKVVAVGDLRTLRAAYDGVAAELAGRYRLTYRTERTGPVDLAIDVRTPQGAASLRQELRHPGRAGMVSQPVTPRTVDSPGLLSSGAGLGLGLAAVFLSMVAVLAAVFVPRRRRSRLADGPRGPDAGALGDLAERASGAAERLLERRGRRRGVEIVLEQAGIAMRAGEFLVLAATGAVVAFAVGFLFGGTLAGIGLAVVAGVLGRLALGFLRDRRRSRFADQLDDVLQMIGGSLRAGYGLLQAVEATAREVPAPASEELRRLTAEVRLGRDFVEALDAVAARVGNQDFEWVSQSIRIHREVGGDLAEVLDRVSETIRARAHLRRQVASLSAEGRLSAVILVLLPIGLTGLMALVNPDYLGELFNSSLGVALVGAAAGLVVAGGLWLRRMVRLVY